MKNTFVLALLAIFLVACNNQKSNRQETVIRYYDALDAGDYDAIKKQINDSITQINGDFTTRYDHDGFYGFFKWDSIFKSSYEIVELEEKNGEVFVTVAQENVRNEFLRNNPLIYKVQVSFALDKIAKLKDFEYIDTNWNAWNKEKDSLVNWIKNNHPDLDGFVNDMTMQGSKNYIKAIELYQSHQNNGN